MTEYQMLQAERTKALEVEVAGLKLTVSSMEGKLDELLELKSKGVGAFWLVSLIGGTFISVVGSTLLDWFRGF